MAVFYPSLDYPGFENQQIPVQRVSNDAGQTWQINRPITFTFSQAVDFSTVNLNTISIQQLGGAPAVGDFFIDSNDDKTVIFQPVCPRLGDLSDAGFRPGGVSRGSTLVASSFWRRDHHPHQPENRAPLPTNPWIPIPSVCARTVTRDSS